MDWQDPTFWPVSSTYVHPYMESRRDWPVVAAGSANASGLTEVRVDSVGASVRVSANVLDPGSEGWRAPPREWPRLVMAGRP